MFYAYDVAHDVISECRSQWSQGAVLAAFEALCGDDNPVDYQDIALLCDAIVTGALIHDGAHEHRAELLHACLAEARHQAQPKHIRLLEYTSETDVTTLGEYAQGVPVLIALAGRTVNEVEWDGDDLIVWVARHG